MNYSMMTRNDGTGACRICGDNAGCGLNFGCLSCESCKAFFRRCCNAKKRGQQQFVCPFVGQCQITKASRRACPACRLEKCVRVGMRKEMVDAWKRQWTKQMEGNGNDCGKLEMSRRRKRQVENAENDDKGGEKQMQMKNRGGGGHGRAVKYTKSDGKNHNNNNNNDSPTNSAKQQAEQIVDVRGCVCKCRCGTNVIELAEKGTQTDECVAKEANPSGIDGANGTILTASEQALVDELVRANALLDMPLRVPPQLLPIVFNLTLMDALRVSEVAMRRMVAMFKQLAAFRSLNQRDQVTLLRSSLVDLLILRGAMAFNPSNEEWRAAIMSATGDQQPHPFCLNLSVLPAKEQHSQEHKRFLMTFDGRWRTNRNVMLILHAIVLFSPPLCSTGILVCKQQIDTFRDKYCHLLKRYLLLEIGGILTSASAVDAAYMHLMGKLRELRQLNASFQWLCSRLNPSKLEPLLNELFTAAKNTTTAATTTTAGRSLPSSSS